MKRLILIHDGEEIRSLHQINFIDDQKRHTGASPERFYHPLVLFYVRSHGFDEKEEDICIPTRSNGCADHPLIQLRSSLVNPWSIKKDELTSFHIFDTKNSV